jgi:hypothetical protein
MNILLSSGLISLFCIDYYSMYNHTVNNNKTLTEKQRAHILSIKASLSLFFMSLYFNIKFINSNLDIDNYVNNFTNGDLFILQLSICNLISYLIVDCIVGYNKYHKYMCKLSGYFHHIVYIFISIITLIKKETAPFYFLYMIEELPTIYLSIGNYNKKLRRDKIFGFTFFITRICFHLFLTWTFKSNVLFLILGLLSLSLHIYWFKNWVTLMFKKKE